MIALTFSSTRLNICSTSPVITRSQDRVGSDNRAKKADYEAHSEKYTEWETDSETGSAAPMHTWPLEQLDPELVARILTEFMPEKVKSLNEHVVGLQRANVTLTARAEHSERELAELRRDLNRHVKVTLAQAIEDWYASSEFLNLAPRTQHETRRAVDSFLATLPEGFKLADLTASRVLAWRGGLRTVDGNGTLAARTLIKNTMYLRSFVSAAYVRYDLRENPMNKISSPGGASSRRESVTAIHSHEELVELLDTVESVDKSYWYPLIATALLAAPRYSELVWIKKSDLNLAQGYVRIGIRRDDSGKVRGGTKKGLERRVPIEKTRLKGILAKYIKRCSNDLSWLFPCCGIGASPIARTKTPEGIWSDGSNFHDALDEIIKKCKKKIGDRHYWDYGPRESRHCAGTAMGHSGNDSARVSSWLGNSESVCRRYYCVAPTSGKLWPLRATAGPSTGQTAEFTITTGAGGVLPGSVTVTELADGSVTNPKLAAGAVTNDKISSGAASANMVLTADGAGNANWGQIDNASLVNSSLTVAGGSGLTGGGLVALGGTTTLSLGSNLTLGETTTGTFSGNGSALTNLSTANLTGTLGNAQLVNSSLTVSAGTGLTGGGLVPLGGSTTLSLGSNLTLGGMTTGTFSGDGSGLTGVIATSTARTPQQIALLKWSVNSGNNTFSAGTNPPRASASTEPASGWRTMAAPT